jgi:hypothetical protein
MTIRADVRARVIELHLQGMKRDDIKKSIGNISTGSVSNIIEAYKSSGKNGTATIDVVKIQEQSELPASNMATIRTASDIKKVGSPVLMTCDGSGTGQATITTTNSSSNVVTPRDGGPLSNLLGEDNTNHTSTDEEEVIPPVTSYSNLPSSVPPTASMSLYPNTNIPSNFNPYFNPYQNNINPQISKPETQESLEPKPQPQPQHQQYHDDNNDSNYVDQEV